MIKRDKLILQTKTLNDGGINQSRLSFRPRILRGFIILFQGDSLTAFG